MGELFIISVTPCAYDAPDGMNDNNFATVLESFVFILSVQVMQLNIKKVPAFENTADAL